MFCCCAKEDGPNAQRVDAIRTEDMEPEPKKQMFVGPPKTSRSSKPKEGAPKETAKEEPGTKAEQQVPEPAPEKVKESEPIDATTVDVEFPETDIRVGMEGTLPDEENYKRIKWWVVELTMDLSPRLGLELAIKPAGLCILNMAADPNMLANVWNRQNEDRQMAAGDVITQVNHVKAFPGEEKAPKMMEEIKRCMKAGQDVLMKVQRVQQFVVPVCKPGALGVEVKEDILTVTNMKPGLIENYNKECDGMALVATGDTMVKVNNVAGDVRWMLTEIAAAEAHVNLVFVRSGVTPIDLHK